MYIFIAPGPEVYDLLRRENNLKMDLVIPTVTLPSKNDNL